MEQYSPKTILLATDSSEGAEPAARAAIGLSKRTGAKLHTALAWVPHFAHPSLVPERYHPPYEEGACRILDERVGRIVLGSVSTKVSMAARGPVLVCPREKSNEGGERP